MTAWLQCAERRPQAGQRLVCFPHAGGSASFFRAWGRALPATEVHAVRYPGRADRIGDALPTDLLVLAEEVALAVRPLLDRPLAFFGHSMGASIAFETARLLEGDGVRLSRLFVSGARAVHEESPAADGSSWEQDDQAAVTRLLELGGTDADLLATPLFRELVLPYVLSDLRMAARYRYVPGPRLSCPVTALVGDADPEVSVRQNAAWSLLTSGGFTQSVRSGGHFYLTSDPPFALVAEALG